MFFFLCQTYCESNSKIKESKSKNREPNPRICNQGIKICNQKRNHLSRFHFSFLAISSVTSSNRFKSWSRQSTAGEVGNSLKNWGEDLESKTKQKKSQTSLHHLCIYGFVCLNNVESCCFKSCIFLCQER